MNKLIRTFFAVLILVIWDAHHGWSQETSIESVERFKKYRLECYQEKVYLHTDRTFYITGDYLWFRVRLVNASSHKTATMSKVVYVELLEAGKPVLQAKVPVNEGVGYAAIYLPTSLNSAVYQLRAYTKWMQNYPAEHYFSKVLTIVNTFKPLTASEESVSNPSVDLQFFPEGGNLIHGLRSRVAFRMVDRAGRPMNREGVIINKSRDTVASFVTAHNGLGVFELLPESGENYQAIVRGKEGAPVRVELPSVRKEGLAIRLLDGDRLKLEIMSTSSAGSVAYVLVHTRGSIKVNQRILINSGKAQLEIDRDLLDDGISHITVFDALHVPACERLYFKKPVRDIHFSASLNATRYYKRRRVIMDISADIAQQPLAEADISLSVYRLDSLQMVDPMDVKNYLLLTSDLKGNVINPGYYFSNEPEARMAADLLMMTHGWTRFTWEEDKHGETAALHVPEYRGHIVSGSIVNANPERISDVPIYLSVPGSRFIFQGTKTYRNGRFQIVLPGYYGYRKVYVQPDLSRDTTLQIRIDDPFSNMESPAIATELELSKGHAEQLLRRSINMQMENAYHEGDRMVTLNPQHDSIPFFGIADAHYELDDYTRFSVMEDVMREYVPGVYVRKRKKDYYFIVTNSSKNELFRSDPLVLVDGLPVFNTNAIMEYDPLNVKSLDVVTHRYLYGALTFYGIVSYRTYAGDLKGFPIDPKVQALEYPGLEYKREFFSPVYELNSEDTRTPDYRDLLYWKPRLTTDSSGKAQVSFYTSDQAGTYAISLQGSLKDGTVGSALFTLTVEDEND